MSVQFAVLASGSKGNSSLIRSDGAALLVDLGLGPRAMAERLASVGSSWSQVAAAVLTHTHGDHVDDATLQCMVRNRATLFCHEGHRPELESYAGFVALENAGLVRHYDERPFLSPNGLSIESVELRHDSGPTFGFRIEAKPQRGKKTVAIGYLADTGCWSEEMADALAEVDVLGVEFNHDLEMQRRSLRSPALIRRNLGDWGHLSNGQGAELVVAVLERSGRGSVRHVVLLHLSHQCNEPQIALRSARSAIKSVGRRVDVHAALQAPAYPNLWITPARRRALSLR